MVKLLQAIALMHETKEGLPIRFDVTYVTYSRHRDDGGDIVQLQDVCISNTDGKSDEKPKVQSKYAAVIGRKPKHFKNKTLNFRLANGQIRKCRIRNIIEFNNQPVVY